MEIGKFQIQENFEFWTPLGKILNSKFTMVSINLLQILYTDLQKRGIPGTFGHSKGRFQK